MKKLFFYTVSILFCLFASFTSLQAQHYSPGGDLYGTDVIQIEWVAEPIQPGETFTITLDLKLESELKTEVIDALGNRLLEVVGTYPEGPSDINMKIKHLDPGLYFIRASTDRTTESEKIVIN